MPLLRRRINDFNLNISDTVVSLPSQTLSTSRRPMFSKQESQILCAFLLTTTSQEFVQQCPCCYQNQGQSHSLSAVEAHQLRQDYEKETRCQSRLCLAHHSSVIQEASP
mmetsp:Transcript_29612/g.87800  ORF Transcript_29612/g.87800 Transcript_29612/m.87800 type:complete len:109 (-) Transcript_29612:1310-1636(-)